MENLNITKEQYQGEVEVIVGNGTKLQIANTGSAIFIAQNSSFQLKFVLHCPAVPINLLSIQKFCAENAFLFELIASSFSVKDLRTCQTILHGHSRHGLYPIPLQRFSFNKAQVFATLFGVHASLNLAPKIWPP